MPVLEYLGEFKALIDACGQVSYFYNMKKFVSTYELITLDECEQRLKNIRDKINSNLDKLLKDNYKHYLSYYKDTVIYEYKKIL